MEQTITLKAEELLYDIKNKSHLSGKAQEISGSDFKVASLKQVGDSEQETSLLYRSLSKAFAECVEMLFPYTKESTDGIPVSNILNDSPQEYSITANLPDTFSATTVTLLKELFHDYMVNEALADWAEIVDPQMAATWTMLAENSKSKVITCIMSRIKMPKRRLSTF